jgi:hypothetical protein
MHTAKNNPLFFILFSFLILARAAGCKLRTYNNMLLCLYHIFNKKESVKTDFTNISDLVKTAYPLSISKASRISFSQPDDDGYGQLQEKPRP